jgi:hypothetical protein
MSVPALVAPSTAVFGEQSWNGHTSADCPLKGNYLTILFLSILELFCGTGAFLLISRLSRNERKRQNNKIKPTAKIAETRDFSGKSKESNMEPPRRRKPYKGVPYLPKSADAEKNHAVNRTETYLFREKVHPKANRNQIEHREL